MVLLCLQIAELVAEEFFEQGDKERRELNIEPIVGTPDSSGSDRFWFWTEPHQLLVCFLCRI